MATVVQEIVRENDETLLQRVGPLLESLEGVRLAKLKIYRWRRKVGLAAAVFLTPAFVGLDAFLLYLQRGSDNAAAGLTVLFLSGLWYWVNKPKREYANAYKTEILPRIARTFGNLSYNVEGKIPMDVLSPSKIIPSHDRYYSEDCFEGAYKGVSVRFSEVKLTERRGSGKNRHTVTTFQGLFVLLGVPVRRFYGHTILKKNENAVCEWFSERATKLKRANLVDPEFEKMFDVFTDDQVEARYLIDPLMIENLKSLAGIYDARTITTAWFESKMLILLPSKKNHFEPAGIGVPATDREALLALKRDLEGVLDIIDHLNLSLERSPRPYDVARAA